MDTGHALRLGVFLCASALLLLTPPVNADPLEDTLLLLLPETGGTFAGATDYTVLAFGDVSGAFPFPLSIDVPPFFPGLVLDTQSKEALFLGEFEGHLLVSTPIGGFAAPLEDAFVSSAVAGVTALNDGLGVPTVVGEWRSVSSADFATHSGGALADFLDAGALGFQASFSISDGTGEASIFGFTDPLFLGTLGFTLEPPGPIGEDIPGGIGKDPPPSSPQGTELTGFGFQPIPEPGSLALVGIGLAVAGLLRRRLRRRA